MQSVTGTPIQVHPTAMQFNFAMSPTVAAAPGPYSFATADGQSFVTAVQPTGAAGTGDLQPVLLSPQTIFAQRPGAAGATAVRYAFPVQAANPAAAAAAAAMTPFSPPSAGAYPCPAPTGAPGSAQSPSPMTTMRPVFVPTTSACVTSPVQVAPGQWQYPYTGAETGIAAAATPAAYSVHDATAAVGHPGFVRPAAGFHPAAAQMIACNPYMGYADAPGRMKRARDCTRPLRDWLVGHRHNPYPQKADKCHLMFLSGLSINQVSMWFANARRRIKKVGMKAWSKGLCEDLPGAGPGSDNDAENDDADDITSDDLLADSDCIVDSASDKSENYITGTASSAGVGPAAMHAMRMHPYAAMMHPLHNGRADSTPVRSFSCSDAEYSQQAMLIGTGTVKRHSLETTAIEFSPVATPQSSYGMADKWSSSSGYATCNDLPTQNSSATHSSTADTESDVARAPVATVPVPPAPPSRPLLTPVGVHIPSVMMSSMMSSPASTPPGVQWCFKQAADMPGMRVPLKQIHD
ncbi:iroquois-class homeodomain protein IRX-1-like [Sycon ciliatum]|uniref:iroquois-class homeodomain protein IRX-1-like n=1 Tax=Sycon ciliatum TaxID=27933 RepID=UPI0031F616C6